MNEHRQVKKYRVRLRPDVDDCFLVVESRSKKEAMELAEDLYGDSDDLEVPDLDYSQMDSATAIDAEEIE